MLSEPCQSVEVQPTTAYTDDRFKRINCQARELREKLRELHQMTIRKCDALLGEPPANTTHDNLDPHEECWADEVINVQNMALVICQDTIDRLALV